MKIFSKNINIRFRKIFYFIIVSLPVIIYTFKISFVYRHGIFGGEDWDYFAQAYEAARISIVHYHQFPWWNPWENGGQPLFANPQIGIFSLQMPLVLLFGTIVGLHFSLFVYFILGFWGMYLLLKRIGSNSNIITILLSYILVFSSFNAWHLSGGHYTFALYLLSPWAFLTVLNIRKHHGWLWFGLTASLLILSAMHYITFEILIICTLIGIFQIVLDIYKMKVRNTTSILHILKPYIYAIIIVAILCGIRIFYTIQFTSEFSRFEPLDPPETFNLFLASLLFRSPINPGTLLNQGITHYGWIEYADYFGITTALLFVYLFIKKLLNFRNVHIQDWLIIISIFIASLMTIGNFSNLSPVYLLHSFPVFNQMRVNYRYVGWIVFGILLFLKWLPKKPLVYLLLLISAIDLFALNYPTLNYQEKKYIQKSDLSSAFKQEAFFDTNPKIGQASIMKLQNYRLLRATQLNTGNIYGYEPILNIGEYYYLPGTDLCGTDINLNCNFVLTNNAVVKYWSPLKIILYRTSPGPVILDMNPGRDWKVNGTPLFPAAKVIETKQNFIIANPAKILYLKFHPAIR